LRRDWSLPRDRVLTPKLGPDSEKRFVGCPLHPRATQVTPLLYHCHYFVYTAHRAAVARSLAPIIQGDYSAAAD